MNTPEKTLKFLDEGYNFPSIAEETGITNEDAKALHTAKKRRSTVWHYTYNAIVDILESGVLLPPRMTPHFNERDFLIRQFGESIKKDKGFQADAKLLLFSQREDWEPASYRAARLGGRIIPLHYLNDYELYGWRVYRVGVSRDLLHPWIRLKRLCGMPPAMARSLEQYAREMGSNPYDWWGTMRPISQDKWRSVEVYNPVTKSWEPLTGIPKVDQQPAPPVPGPTFAPDVQGNVAAGREIVSRSSPAASSTWGYL